MNASGVSTKAFWEILNSCKRYLRRGKQSRQEAELKIRNLNLEVTRFGDFKSDEKAILQQFIDEERAA